MQIPNDISPVWFKFQIQRNQTGKKKKKIIFHLSGCKLKMSTNNNNNNNKKEKKKYIFTCLVARDDASSAKGSRLTTCKKFLINLTFDKFDYLINLTI